MEPLSQFDRPSPPRIAAPVHVIAMCTHLRAVRRIAARREARAHAEARLAGRPVRHARRRIDYGRLGSLLAGWSDAAGLARILVRNPATLYGF
jgi:hypothetical protein